MSTSHDLVTTRLANVDRVWTLFLNRIRSFDTILSQAELTMIQQGQFLEAFSELETDKKFLIQELERLVLDSPPSL